MDTNVQVSNSAQIAQNQLLCEGLCCPKCNSCMEQTDTVYSNINTSRATVGQHTGNIYTCTVCEIHWLENFLNKSKLEGWSY
jgi:hypothetical protein